MVIFYLFSESHQVALVLKEIKSCIYLH